MLARPRFSHKALAYINSIFSDYSQECVPRENWQWRSFDDQGSTDPGPVFNDHC